MRILLAIDGSAPADTARALVASLPWPEGSHIDVIRVVEPVIDIIGLPIAPTADMLPGAEGGHLDAVRSEIEGIAASFAGPNVTADGVIHVGRPASVIVETAERSFADLVVVGSRGHGMVSSMLLGSVSAEVVDHAPCPVLVARRPSVRRVVVALDGSPLAEGLLAAVEAATFLAGARVEVVSVAPSTVPSPAVVLAGNTGMPLSWYEESVDAAHGVMEKAAAAAADRLKAAGLDATSTVIDGDPASALIDHAAEHDVDLVVMGTHGRTGLSRLLLGSVVRNVLLHSHASLLVVRRPWLGASPQPAPQPSVDPTA